MRLHEVRVQRPGKRSPKETELAWKIAEVASADHPDDIEVTEMVINRVIDNAACAIAAINRAPVANARSQALAFPRPDAATLFGLPSNERFDCLWAAWANCSAVRELDFHDSFFSHESSHPGDTISPLIALAQQRGLGGRDLLRGIATAYEIQIDLGKGIPLNKYRIDHVAHLGPAVAAGLGAMLKLDTTAIYQAVQHAAHVSSATRQARKGVISSWKANAPGHVGKAAIEAVDRAMRGETSPSPIYEGDYGILAILLGGEDMVCQVPLPDPDEPRRAILESYPKEHSAGYHGQALIDLAFRMREKIPDFKKIRRIDIHTKHLTHIVMGSGAGDPEKWDPEASRETLDHSAMYIFTVALQDGRWHHDESYARGRACRPDTVDLWRKVQTVESEEWTRRFNEPAPLEKDHGARAVITFEDGAELADEIAVANAHPRGQAPFKRSDYTKKFDSLTVDFIEPAERDRFLQLSERLARLQPDELLEIMPVVSRDRLISAERDRRGIF